MAKSQKVYYFEYYPHYMGTVTRTLVAPLAVFKEIQAQIKRGDDDAAYELAASLGASYFITDALGDDWDGVNFSYLSRCKNKSKGGQVEEGSFGFSLTSAKAAARACMAAEAKCMEECGEYY